MKKLRFLLLDAGVVFQLFELGLWDQIIDRCDIILSRIVAEKEVKYFHGEEADEQIDLTPYVVAGRSKPARGGQVKTGHLEELLIRDRSTSSPRWAEGGQDGESPQNGKGSRDTGTSSARLVVSADCP